jgi:hypothetical protein
MVKVWNTNNKGEERERTRTPDGKFARSDGQPTVDGGVRREEADQPAEAAAEQTQRRVAPAIDPPNSWSPEAKARWSSVPPEVQAVIARRESDVHRFVTQYGQKARELETRMKSVEPLEQVASQYRDYFRSKGADVHQAFHQLAALQQRFDSDPVSVLLQLGAEKGIDLRPYFQHVYGNQGAAEQAQSAVYDPRMVQYLQEQGQEVAQLKNKLTGIEQAEKAAMDRHLGGMIDSFKQQAPFFDHLRPVMANLLEVGQASTLEEAYEQALFADPQTRERVLQYQRERIQASIEEERKTAMNKEREQAQAAAERGRRSGSLPVRGNIPGAKSKPSIDDTLNAAARAAFPDWRPSA